MKTRDVLTHGELVTAQVLKTVGKWSIVKLPDGRIVAHNPNHYGVMGFHPRYATMPAPMQAGQRSDLQRAHGIPRTVVDAMHKAHTR